MGMADGGTGISYESTILEFDIKSAEPMQADETSIKTSERRGQDGILETAEQTIY